MKDMSDIDAGNVSVDEGEIKSSIFLNGNEVGEVQIPIEKLEIKNVEKEDGWLKFDIFANGEKLGSDKIYYSDHIIASDI